jgi:hypothetical protein
LLASTRPPHRKNRHDFASKNLHQLSLLDDPSPPANATLQTIREQLKKYLAENQ